jgi:superfamily I DNA/RNA helicase
MANRLIENNPTRASRVLKARPGNPTGEVLVLQWPSLVAEADGLAGLITDRLAVGTVEAGRILVLAPRRQIGYAIRDALIGGGVPAHSFFYEESLDGNPMDLGDCHAQEAFALLTLVARPDDRVALRCWCGFGSPSLNAGAWKKVRQYSASTGISPRAVLEQLAAGTLTLPRAEAVIARFRLLQTRLSSAAGLRGTDLIDAVFPSTADWAAQIRVSVASAEPESEPGDLLETIQRAITQPELPTDVDYVRVMSLHKSKGLTADLVIVVGCIEGLIPTLAGDAAPDAAQRALEEQRRLFYVAITRATQTLVLSSVTRLQRADAHKMGARVAGGNRVEALAVASRFLAEMGPDRPPAIDGRSLHRLAGGRVMAENR